MDIDLLSNNETATVLWSANEAGDTLGTIKPTLLTIVSRTEPTGFHWQDTTRADIWGSGPMLVDPVRVRLTLRTTPDPRLINLLSVAALDSTGMPMGADGLEYIRTTDGWVLDIDQSKSHAIWYSLNWMIHGSAPDDSDNSAITLSASADRLHVTLPGVRSSVRIEIFDALGRSAGVLHDGSLGSGERAILLDRRGLAAGVYLARVTTERGEQAVARVVVVR